MKTSRSSKINRLKAETRVLLHLMSHPRLAANIDKEIFFSDFGEYVFLEIVNLSSEGVYQINPSMLEDAIDNRTDLTGNFIKFSNQYEAYQKLSSAKQHDMYIYNKEKLEKLHTAEELGLWLEVASQQLYEGADPDDVLFSIKNLNSYNAGRVIPSTKIGLESIFQPNINNIKTGIDKLDYLGGLSRGNMIAIAADSGMQKTMWSLWFVIHMLQINPSMKAIYFEKEMPAHDIYIRILAYLTKKPIQEILSIGLTNDASMRSSLMSAFQNATEREVYKSLIDRLKVVPSTHFYTANDMWKIVEKERADIWVLDYATMLMNDGAEKNYDLYMKKEFLTMKNMLGQTNSVGIVLSQLKQTNSVDLRRYKVPLINDMEWGKTLKQFSTYVFGLFSPKIYHPDNPNIENEWFYLIPNKSRNGKLEPIPFLAEPSICTYNIPTEPDERRMIGWLTNYRGKYSDKAK